jgi:hypothetical protein
MADPTSTVVLRSPGPRKIQVIKVVREVTGLGLKEAKDIVDHVPSELSVPDAQTAELVRAALEGAGAVVELHGPGQAASDTGGHGSGPAADPIDQIRRLDELREKGLITDAEFQAKKTELLGRL